jgi:hypothetical protein
MQVHQVRNNYHRCYLQLKHTTLLVARMHDATMQACNEVFCSFHGDCPAAALPRTASWRQPPYLRGLSSLPVPCQTEVWGLSVCHQVLQSGQGIINVTIEVCPPVSCQTQGCRMRRPGGERQTSAVVMQPTFTRYQTSDRHAHLTHKTAKHTPLYCKQGNARLKPCQQPPTCLRVAGRRGAWPLGAAHRLSWCTHTAHALVPHGA